MISSFVHSAKQLGYFLYGYVNGWRSQRYSRQALERLQQRRFAQLKRRVLRHSPFFAAFGDKPLQAFPIMDKTAFLANFDQINTCGLSLAACQAHALQAEQQRDFATLLNGVAVGLSSGTSGRRGVFLTRPQEQAEWAGYIIAKNLPLKFRRQRVALLLRSNNALYEASQGIVLSFRFFDLTLPLAQWQAQLQAYQPDILIAPAQVLGVIAAARLNIAPTKIISVAEVLEPDVRQRIEQQFDCVVNEIYQCTEGYLASTCRFGRLHLNEDIVVIEKHWTDKASGRFSPVITDLRRRTLPLVRFKLDDILQLDPSPCPCGSALTALKKIEGRCDDSLWFIDNTEHWQAVFPDLVRRAMMLCSDIISDYRIQQHGEKLLILLETAQPDIAKQSVTTALQHLAQSQQLRLPELEFAWQISAALTDKCRRVACLHKPVLQPPEY